MQADEGWVSSRREGTSQEDGRGAEVGDKGIIHPVTLGPRVGRALGGAVEVIEGLREQSSYAESPSVIFLSR